MNQNFDMSSINFNPIIYVREQDLSLSRFDIYRAPHNEPEVIQHDFARFYMPTEPINRGFDNASMPEISFSSPLIVDSEKYYYGEFRFEPFYTYQDISIILSIDPKSYCQTVSSKLSSILNRKSGLTYFNSLTITFYKAFLHRFTDTIKPLLGILTNPNNPFQFHFKDNLKFNSKFQF